MTTQDPALATLAEGLLAGRSSVSIVSAMAPQQPDQLIRALLDVARGRGIRVRLLVADTSGAFTFLDERAEADLDGGWLSIVTLAGSVPRRLASRVDSIPLTLWDVDRLLGTGDIACDIFVVAAARRDDGQLDVGNSIGYTSTLLERPGVVVAVEVAPVGRFVTGLGSVEAALWDGSVRWADPAPLDPRFGAVVSKAPGSPSAPDDTRDRIAAHLAGLVPSGATLQIGVGGVTDALLDAVAGRTDVGIHSGLLPSSLRAYLADGRFAGRRKAVDPGLAVATSLAPDSDGSPWPASALLRPLAETHSPAALAEHDALFAVNSAFEVDLSGQVNAEWAGPVKVASGGGQYDFMRAAHVSARGAAVIALPSRSGRGVSRIVPTLAREASVTTAAGDVDFVVTEFGIADLRGRSREERAERLVAVAHPDDRPMLDQRLSQVGMSPNS